MRFCVIVFFDKARTEFIVHGPFTSYDAARHNADETLKLYAPGIVDCVDIAALIGAEGKKVGGTNAQDAKRV